MLSRKPPNVAALKKAGLTGMEIEVARATGANVPALIRVMYAEMVDNSVHHMGRPISALSKAEFDRLATIVARRHFNFDRPGHAGGRMIFPRVTTVAEARTFIRRMVDILGLGYHPDTRAADYVTGDGQRLFDAATARSIDARNGEVFEILEDPFEVAVEEARRELGRGRSSGKATEGQARKLSLSALGVHVLPKAEWPAVYVSGKGVKSVLDVGQPVFSTQDAVYEDHVRGMMREIAAGEDIGSVSLVKIQDRFYIFDGHHRFAAYRQMNRPVPAFIYALGGPDRIAAPKLGRGRSSGSSAEAKVSKITGVTDPRLVRDIYSEMLAISEPLMGRPVSALTEKQFETLAHAAATAIMAERGGRGRARGQRRGRSKVSGCRGGKTSSTSRPRGS